ncbi:MAG: NAD-dependent epimerase/dehydratase family protein [Desulfurococcaceae archaeon]
MKLEQILSEYSGKKILVTGGAGCVGRNLTMTLLQTDVEHIVIIDDFSSSPAWNVPNDKRVFLIKGSILDAETMWHAFSFGPNIVFHLAAHFANQNSVEHPETDLMVNGLGTLKALQYSKLVSVQRFVYASSGCSVYGSQAPLPLEESFVSLHLDTPYQIHKLLGELYCNFFHDYYGLPVTTARLFNVYGPGEVPGRYRNVIPNFIWWAMNGKPLPITGTGEETRDFTYVGDVVKGLLVMGISEEAVGEAINLASGTETKIIDLARMVNAMTSNGADVVFLSRRPWDRIIRRRASIEKARKLLGYEPETDIKTGLSKVYDWLKENYENIKNFARF